MRMTCAVSFALTLVLVTAGVGLAGDPTDQLRRNADEVLNVVRSQREGATRRTEMRRIGTRLFDFEETAKRALGPHWQQRTPAERAEFVTLFRDLLEAAYVGEAVEGDQATVKTRVVTKQGTEIPVDYRMLRESGDWRVYDVVIEGVSFVGNYRTQFNKIIQTSSYQDLVKRLRAKDVSSAEGARGRRS